jgi:hypothetical protein
MERKAKTAIVPVVILAAATSAAELGWFLRFLL